MLVIGQKTNKQLGTSVACFVNSIFWQACFIKSFDIFETLQVQLNLFHE